MATKKLPRSKVSKKLTPAQAKGLAKVLSDAAQQVADEKVDFEKRSAARKAREAQLVPMGLGDVCRVIGPDVESHDFATTSLMSLAMQLDGLLQLAEESTDGGYDQWCAVSNVVYRMKLASRVSRWLESGKPASLPEVQP